MITEMYQSVLESPAMKPLENLSAELTRKISDLLPLKRWAAITSTACKQLQMMYWEGRPAQRLLSMQEPTSIKDGNFYEIAEHHWNRHRMKVYRLSDLDTSAAKYHFENCEVPSRYAFELMYHGHGVGATSEQICWDHLAWLQCLNRFDLQYYMFAERIMKKDMFTGADTHCIDSEVEKVMEQVLAMGSYGVIRNTPWVMRYSTLIEHIYINASPPSVQNDIAILPWNDHPGRQEVMWAAHRNLPPRFWSGGKLNEYDAEADQIDQDAIMAYQLQETLNEKDQVVYDQQQLQLQQEAEETRRMVNDNILRKSSKFRAKQRKANRTKAQPKEEGKVKSELLIMAMSLCNNHTIAEQLHDAAATQSMANQHYVAAEAEQQVPMSQFNSRKNLEAILEVVQPPNAPIEDDEEVDENLRHFNDFEDSIITFHGSAPEGSPAEEPGDEAE